MVFLLKMLLVCYPWKVENKQKSEVESSRFIINENQAKEGKRIGESSNAVGKKSVVSKTNKHEFNSRVNKQNTLESTAFTSLEDSDMAVMKIVFLQQYVHAHHLARLVF